MLDSACEVMKIIISKLTLYLDLKNENHKQKLLWLNLYCFYMKIMKVHKHHAFDKNNAEYVDVGTFPQ